MLEDLFYNLLVLYQTDYFHLSVTSRASQVGNLLDFLNQSGPVLSIFLGVLIRFQDTGYPFILVLFFPFAPADIAVITVVPDHLFSLAPCF